MKLKNVSDLKLWLPVSKTFAKIHLEFFATVVSVTIQRDRWALPSVLDVRFKYKDFQDNVMFYDSLLQKFD